MLEVFIDGAKLLMELDTGAAVSCMSKQQFDSLKLKRNLKPSSRNLSVANGQFVKTVSITYLNVEFRGSKHDLILHVVDDKFPALFGREWIVAFFGDK